VNELLSGHEGVAAHRIGYADGDVLRITANRTVVVDASIGKMIDTYETAIPSRMSE